MPNITLAENQPKVAIVALHAGYSHSSLALQSLAAYAEEWGCAHQMQMYEALVNTNHQHLLESLVEYQPKLLGFSTYLWNIAASIHLTRVIKQLFPDVRVVFGGPEAGARGAELLASVPEIDYVIAGEGESAFTDLMNCIFQIRVGMTLSQVYATEKIVRFSKIPQALCLSIEFRLPCQRDYSTVGNL